MGVGGLILGIKVVVVRSMKRVIGKDGRVYQKDMGVPKIRCTWGFHNWDYSILGPILRNPYFGKLLSLFCNSGRSCGGTLCPNKHGKDSKPTKTAVLLKGPTQGLSLFSSPNQLFRKMSDTSSSEALREGMA